MGSCSSNYSTRVVIIEDTQGSRDPGSRKRGSIESPEEIKRRVHISQLKENHTSRQLRNSPIPKDCPLNYLRREVEQPRTNFFGTTNKMSVNESKVGSKEKVGKKEFVVGKK